MSRPAARGLDEDRGKQQGSEADESRSIFHKIVLIISIAAKKVAECNIHLGAALDSHYGCREPMQGQLRGAQTT